MTDMVASLAALDTAPAESGEPPIALVGSGQLHAALASLLGERCRSMAVESLTGHNAPAALVVASDGDDTRCYPVLHRWAAQQGMPWLGVRVEGDWVLVGPAVLPGRPGCPTCVARRRRANRSDGEAWQILRQQYETEIATTPSVLVTPLVAKMVAALVTNDLRRLAHDQISARTHGALLCLSLRAAALARHPLLPDPLCPQCAALPEDTAQGALIRPRRLPKPDPAVLRVRELSTRQAELEQLYVDLETGVIASLGSGAERGSPVAVARLSPTWARHDSQHGYGRTGDFRSATLTAITEALERMASTRPRGRRPAVGAAYADVAEQALDPRALGLYPDSWYDQPDFRYVRFHPDRETSWVWGYSFARAEPILVPQAYAYYGPSRKDDPGFVYECSNGCALGGCLEEAILYGLLEIAERDAFLMTWYTRMPAPKVDLHSARDRRIPVAAELIRHRHGYEVMAFNTTLEQHVPAFWTMAVDQVGGPDRPRVMCGAGAHPDAERALRGALHELGRWTWPRYGDLGQDLAELIGRYLASGLDVIAVDTTSPEHRAGGFACAKVIVPGTLSMTFGHRYRRMYRLARLATVPRLLGFRTTELGPEELNPFPHPFA